MPKGGRARGRAAGRDGTDNEKRQRDADREKPARKQESKNGNATKQAKTRAEDDGILGAK